MTTTPAYHPTSQSLLSEFLRIVQSGGRPSRISALDGRLAAFTYQKTRHMAWEHACLSDEFAPEQLQRELAEIAARLDLEMDRPPRRVGDLSSAIVVRAMAGDCYQHKGLKGPLESRKMERQALDAGYAQRAEIYQRYTLRMDLTHVDLKSAFPCAALHPLPVGPLLLAPRDTPPRPDCARLWRCRVHGNRTYNEQVAALPYYSKRGILFPHGTFEGVFWEVEIDAAERAGCEVERLDLYVCRTSPRLSWSMRKLVALRSDDRLGPLAKQVANVAIGKLRARNSRTEYRFDPPDKTGWQLVDPGTGLFTRVVHKKTRPPTYCPQAWGWIQAYVRAQLLDQLMMTFEPCVCYADMVLGAGASPIDTQWKIKGLYKNAIFAGRSAGSWAVLGENGRYVSRWQGLERDLLPGETIQKTITPGLGRALRDGAVASRRVSAPTLAELARCDAPIWGRRTIKGESETYPPRLGEGIDAAMRY